MEGISVWFGVISYGVAAATYASIAAILVASRPGGLRLTSLTAVVAASIAWSLATAFLLLIGFDVRAFVILDALYMFVWTAYTVSWLAPREANAPGAKGRFNVSALLVFSGLGAIWAIEVSILSWSQSGVANSVAGLLCMSLIGLLAVEQVYRNAREIQRRSFWLLGLALGGVFVAQLFIYSQAILINRFVPFFWESRGLLVAALAPLLVYMAKQQSAWERDLFVSRQVAFYTASLLGVGAYLTVMALVAYSTRAVGGQWGPLLEVGFLIAAIVLLVLVLRSTFARAQLKVFLVKHFYKNKYDYRHEWLRLTDALGQAGGTLELAQYAIDGLANIVGASRGDLWLTRDSQHYEWVATLSPSGPPTRNQPIDNRLIQFLSIKGWVIDSEEYAANPDRYGSAFGHPEEGILPRQTLVVPLDLQGRLLGFAVISRPQELGALNFEDHDILKTAGRQVAAALAQALAQEQLLETRQFEAMNKLSTFLMHDLKNVVAQQELVMANAQRFRDRPEFISDMIATVRASVERMRRLLEQLRNAGPMGSSGHRTDLSKVIMEVRSHCVDRPPIPELTSVQSPVYVDIERDGLNSILTHLVRNAQDATDPDGRVHLSAHLDKAWVNVIVRDTGCGMTKAFVRDRLFRPFDSTKGAKGMGIGAYQVRELVRSVGGNLEVVSQPGEGTEFRIRLPTELPADDAQCRDSESIRKHRFGSTTG